MPYRSITVRLKARRGSELHGSLNWHGPRRGSARGSGGSTHRGFRLSRNGHEVEVQEPAREQSLRRDLAVPPLPEVHYVIRAPEPLVVAEVTDDAHGGIEREDAAQV